MFDSKNNFSIAITSDPHLFDMHEDIGIPPENLPIIAGKPALVRTFMDSILSTHVFNENYVAFIAMLDEIVKKGVKYLVICGDYSDDGELCASHRLKKTLEEYETKFQLRTFLTVGNHDINRPAGMHLTKTFLSKSGKSFTVSSDINGIDAKNDLDIKNSSRKNNGSKNNISRHVDYYSKTLQAVGYAETIPLLGAFGFFKRQTDLLFETPFGESDLLVDRQFTVQIGNQKIAVPDMSYLVEPEEGLWILSIDANVHLIDKSKVNYNEDINSQSPIFDSPSNTGWNYVMEHKKHLLPWIASVFERSKILNKKVVFFSHYPISDFLSGTEKLELRLFGNNSWIKRNPQKKITDYLFSIGVKSHFSGHMHAEFTSEYLPKIPVMQIEEHLPLRNYGVPSLTSFPSNYKIINCSDVGLSIKNYILQKVPDFDLFFGCYRQEIDALPSGLLRQDCLKMLCAQSYEEFIRCHLSLLIKYRYLENEWPKDLAYILVNLNFSELLYLSNMEELTISETNRVQVFKMIKKMNFENIQSLTLNSLKDENYSGLNLIEIFYALRLGCEITKQRIMPPELNLYQKLITHYLGKQYVFTHSIQNKIKTFLSILNHYLHG